MSRIRGLQHEVVRPEGAECRIDLTELAVCVRTEIEAMRQAWCNALHRAMNAGDGLLTAQAVFQTQPDTQGGWKKWLKTHCLLKERTAFLYMRLARYRPQIEAEIHNIGEISLRRAVDLIKKPPKKTPDDGSEEQDDEQSADDPSEMIAAWKASPKARQAFLDHIGVDAVLEEMSSVFGRDLRARVPAPKKRKSLNLPASSGQSREHRFRH